MNKLKHIIKRYIIDLFKTKKLSTYYLFNASRAMNEKQVIIYMADGRCLHGGLSDRLSGMVSIYQYCKKYDKQFKINFTCPYELENILQPNLYDWRIQKNEISYNTRDVKVRYISLFSFDIGEMRSYVDKCLQTSKRQVHVYSNMRYFRDNEFAALFDELFKPSPLLEEKLEIYRQLLPKEYISLTFRFQQLLGDFNEGNFPTLPNQEQKDALITRCLDCISKLYDNVKMPILVTSDSSIFLKKANLFSYVYTIPGQIRHIDFDIDPNTNIDVDIKSYLDLLMIASAEIIHLCTISPLYRSGFPETASRIFNHKYKEISE